MITKQDTIYEWIQNGQLEDALKALFQNIEEEPNTIENYINAGIVLADINEIEKAERFFQRAITIDDNNGAVYYNLANLITIKVNTVMLLNYINWHLNTIWIK